MGNGLIFYECTKFMKKLINRFFYYVRKEWFLIVMVVAITAILLLFELLS